MKRTVQFAYTFYIYKCNSLLELFDPSFVSSDRARPAVMPRGVSKIHFYNGEFDPGSG